MPDRICIEGQRGPFLGIDRETALRLGDDTSLRQHAQPDLHRIAQIVARHVHMGGIQLNFQVFIFKSKYMIDRF